MKLVFCANSNRYASAIRGTLSVGLLALGSLWTGEVRGEPPAEERPAHFDAHAVSHEHHESRLGKHHHPHFTPPLFMDSPIPHNVLRLDYRQEHLSGEHGGPGGTALTNHRLIVIAGYAFSPALGLETIVPFVVQNPAAGDVVAHTDNVKLAVKLASCETLGFFHGYGLETAFPTGDGEHIGSDREVEFEPYLMGGWKERSFEAALRVAVAIPVNQEPEEAPSNELHFGAYGIAHLADFFAAIFEIQGHAVLNGEDRGHTSLLLAPGFRLYPFRTDSLSLGTGLGFGVLEPELDVSLLTSVAWHY